MGGSADNGADAGGAIFSFNAFLLIADSTFSGNQSTGSGAGIVFIIDTITTNTIFVLDNTIVANNGANECYADASQVSGAGNLIMQNGDGVRFGVCPGVVTTSDPNLGPLQQNSPGNTPTMAIVPDSPAFNTADNSTSLLLDQRGVSRPQLGGFDIGAFEVRSPFGTP